MHGRKSAPPAAPRAGYPTGRSSASRADKILLVSFRLVALLAFVAACPAPKPPNRPTGAIPVAGIGKMQISWARVEAPSDVPTSPPEPGTFRVHPIDAVD